MRPLAVALAAVALSACTTPAANAPPPPPRPEAARAPITVAPPDEPVPVLQLPEDVRPLRYALHLDVDPGHDGFAGDEEITVELARPRRVIWLNGRGLRVQTATVAGDSGAPRAATYEQVTPEGVARLVLSEPIGPGRAILRLAWDAPWGNLAGLYLSHTGGATFAVSQFEAFDARRMFPGFDEPRFKTPFDVALTVPAKAVAVSNAPVLGEVQEAGGARRVRFATTAALPTYLVFVGVGPFEVVEATPLPPNEVRSTPLPLRGLAAPGHGAELAFALEATAAVVPWFERYFGIPYPYPKLDQLAASEFAFGGMENAGAILYDDRALLLSPRSSTDDRRRVASVVAHEIAHQWFGDLVTLPWWTDAWLNESFATWIGTRAVDRWRPELGAGLSLQRRTDAVMEGEGLAAARPIRRPLAAMDQVHDQFDGVSYQKGAGVLGMFEGFVGEERFRDGIRDYLRAHAHGTGTAEALYGALSRAAGTDLGPALASFTDQPGMPLVSVRLECGAQGAVLHLKQSRWLPRGSEASPSGRWGIPVCVRSAPPGTRDVSHVTCMLLDQEEGTLPLGNLCPAWVMPAAAGRGYYRFALDEAGLAALRRAGLPHLDRQEKLALADNLRAGQRAGAVPWGEAMGTILALARDPDPELAVVPAAVLAELRDRVLPPAERPAIEAATRRAYRPLLDRLGWAARPGDAPAERRLRAVTVEALVVTGRDPAARREAARRGAQLVGVGAPPRADAVDPDLAGVAVAAAVELGGEPVLDAVLGRLAESDDPAVRGPLLDGLALVEEPAIARRVAALWRDRRVRLMEALQLMGELAGHPGSHDAAIERFEEDADAILAAVPDPVRGYLPAVAAAGSCDAASADRLSAVLQPRVARYPELRLKLAQALERIRLCAAEREASAPAARAFFAERRAAR